MNRLKLLAAAMLLALPIACGDPVDPPPPTGSIDGLVSVEGQGVDGVSVTLSNGATAITANGGMYRFDGVEAGAYTVTISNYPDDATFDQTSSAATIATDGENVTVNFPGSWIRTSAIMGAVTVENEGLGGVTVKLSGMSNSETLTDANGQYAFTGLRAGNYTVEISGFDEDDVAFGSTASTAMIAVGESKVVPFEGTYLRTSGVTGQVTVGNNPLADVTVSLQGRGEEREATTNGAGQFTFSELRSGDYSVGITNPDPDLYGFDVTSQTVTVAHGETASVPFEGIYLRTASIMGTVTVEGTGLGEVTVTLQGEGEEKETTTNAAGQFSFPELHAGDYSVGITNPDPDLYGFDVTTATVTVPLQETATVPFKGIMLRTAAIAGTVTVEGHAISATVTVTGGPKDEEHETTTNDAGYYIVDELHAGDYAVAISDFDQNEYEFEATTQSVSVGLRKTATVAFQGELLRTAGISGRVSVEGMGLDEITVTLSGDADATMMTADGGQYAFTGLAEGDYTVAIEGWDEDAYEFEMSSADLAVAQDEAVVQNFEGMHTRTASVSGMLFLDELDGDGMYTEGEPAFAQAGVPLLLQGPGVNDV
ncbi:MAG: carboxypeptidase regulatory-like domain-containing protein, partial [Gemmatimonadota bacterium]|nr:carboxypeptidase regulatory-like domain-containing protein [Gemmatimonadota bacterium]